MSSEMSSDGTALGCACCSSACGNRAATDLRAVAHPVLRRLRDRFDETVNLGIPDGAGILYIDIVESSLGLRMAATVGAHDDMHSTAIGKAIASTWSRGQQERIDFLALPPKTARTITSADQLERELDAVHLRGIFGR